MSDLTLKDYVDAAIQKEHELRVLQFGDMKTALDLARVSMEKRLDAMNELRAQITQERGHFVSRELFDRIIGTLEERIRAGENFKSNIEGRVLAVGGLVILVQLAIAFFRK